jgi:hypothetical protein
MKFLILSDSHGNKFGLQAVLESGRPYDRIICLGDVVGYGAHPNECCRMLREREAISLSGNHDAAALGKIDIEWFNPVAKTAILWTREQLTPENRAWLDGLPAEQSSRNGAFKSCMARCGSRGRNTSRIRQCRTPNSDDLSQPLCFTATPQACFARSE